MQNRFRKPPLSANKVPIILPRLAAALLFTCAIAIAQSPGQPPVEACKPGDFTVIGYPDEFGPLGSQSFRVKIDEGFQGEFQTRERIWLPAITAALDQWNAVSGSNFRFEFDGLTRDFPNVADGVLNILPCGVLFGCPEEGPPSDPGGPGLPPGTVLTNGNAFETALAVTLIFEDSTTGKAVSDAIIEFNPLLPFNVNPKSNEFDFNTVLLHELGHSFGLGHSDNCNVGPTIMESVVDFGAGDRTFRPAEVEGVKFLYPSPEQPAVRIFERDQSVRFDVAQGGLPESRRIEIHGTRPSQWSANVLGAAGSWLVVNPPSGIFTGRGTSIELQVTESGLPAGLQTAVVEVNIDGWSGPPARLEVELNVAADASGPIPFLTSNGIINGANLLNAQLTGGSLISIFGVDLATKTEQASGFPLPTNLGGATVVIDGKIAPILYASGGQINAIVPASASAGPSGVIVRTGFGQTRSVGFGLAQAAPQAFVIGDGHGLILNQDGTLNSADNPAAPGSIVSVFFTGVGPVDPPLPDGRPASSVNLSWSTSEYAATIGGQTVHVSFMGLTPDFAGLAQANLVVPELSGNAPVSLTIAGIASNPVLLSIR
jgi:uncharacterized protein (TIGR03437 family)